MCGFKTYQDPRLTPPEEPEETPREVMVSCAHASACVRACDVALSGNADEPELLLGCADCPEWEGIAKRPTDAEMLEAGWVRLPVRIKERQEIERENSRLYGFLNDVTNSRDAERAKRIKARQEAGAARRDAEMYLDMLRDVRDEYVAMRDASGMTVGEVRVNVVPDMSRLATMVKEMESLIRSMGCDR